MDIVTDLTVVWRLCYLLTNLKNISTDIFLLYYNIFSNRKLLLWITLTIIINQPCVKKHIYWFTYVTNTIFILYVVRLYNGGRKWVPGLIAIITRNARPPPPRSMNATSIHISNNLNCINLRRPPSVQSSFRFQEPDKEEKNKFQSQVDAITWAFLSVANMIHQPDKCSRIKIL